MTEDRKKTERKVSVKKLLMTEDRKKTERKVSVKKLLIKERFV
jgi:hypothetical protein